MSSPDPWEATEVARKSLSLNEIRSRIDTFVAEWKDESRESAEYATFWDQLLNCFGVERRRVATFQQQAQRASTGNTGFIDFFWPKVAIGEHKSLGKMGPEGVTAEEQAYDYLAGGSITPEDFPRYVISTDFANMRVTDLDAEGGPKSTYFAITDLRSHIEELAFLGGYQATSINTEEQETASIRAAQIMANLYEAMLGDRDQDYSVPVIDEDDEDDTIHATAILLTRLLFLMFGDDADLWERGLFERFIRERTAPDGSDLGSQLMTLFRVLDTHEDRRPTRLDETIARFPYVNGGIFDKKDDLGLLAFDANMRAELLAACAFDWSTISPAVFGSLFQAVKSRDARRTDGEHYTTETNILKVLNPLFLDEYRSRVRSAWNNVRQLNQIREELGKNSYSDVACGSGNFLILAYRELRDIELTIMLRERELTGANPDEQFLDVSMGLTVTLDQFTGVELNWWPAKIAETAMFLVDHQANVKMAKAWGQAPKRLPITISANIKHANALTIDWNTVIPRTEGKTYVFGNPPFLGDNTRDKQQKAELQAAWGDRTLSRMDYVTAWHALSLRLYATPDRHGDWAFVTTNSITQGDQVPRLFGPIHGAGWRIKFAHRTFAWASEAPGAAAVHCVVVGFTKGDAKARLFDYASPTSEPLESVVRGDLNAYLLDAPWALVEKRSTLLNPQLNQTSYGSKPSDGGNLIVEPDDYAEVAADPIAAKYLHRYIGAKELLHNNDRWCLWLEDVNPSDIVQSSVLRERVDAVREFRGKSTAASTRDYRHHHLFRQLGKQDTSFVCIPIHVSETRNYYPVAFYDADVISSNATFNLQDPDGFQFAIISSSMFITWQRAIGGRIKSDLRFASTLTWYTFPLPHVDERLYQRIADAGKLVLNARNKFPERSLAEHYNPLAMDPALVSAHDALDREVDKAFGSRSRIQDEDKRQKLLFNSYQTLIEAEQVVIRERGKRKRR